MAEEVETKYWNSSTVIRTDYTEVTKILQVKFIAGTYKYHDVPVDVYKSLIAASNGSIGKAINQIIKGKYQYSKID